ncbi:hypothetical protein RH858_16170 [Halalkaliarchaeum sp. AArc-GB]|uniref:hypothetical protein n=1 Tax=Halalkaliarchaeum sp. AArc-GB TaxID=3074078 RepID=UPI00285BD5D7|nr:hypothetical protein [Halalkaliarchaeum sp. AArc-GB]MDR5674662.1 hypothetical protein [Halalkaliarchaeum sp. AArc-GB]
MPFSIEYADGAVLEWYATDDGARVRRVSDYEPTIYVASQSADDLSSLVAALHDRTDVSRTSRERWRTAFRNDPEPVLRIDVASIDRVRPLAGWILRRDRPGTYRLFNVDLSPEFRYCLERDVTPVPDRELRTLKLGDPTSGTPDDPVTAVEFGGESAEREQIEGDPTHVLGTLSDRLERVDPDVLVCSSAELVPALFETARAHDCDFQLGRRPGYEQLAGASTSPDRSARSGSTSGNWSSTTSSKAKAAVRVADTTSYRSNRAVGGRSAGGRLCFDSSSSALRRRARTRKPGTPARTLIPLSEVETGSHGNETDAGRVRHRNHGIRKRRHRHRPRSRRPAGVSRVPQYRWKIGRSGTPPAGPGNGVRRGRPCELSPERTETPGGGCGIRRGIDR